MDVWITRMGLWVVACVPDVTPQTDDDLCPRTVNCDHLARHRVQRSIPFLFIILRGSSVSRPPFKENIAEVPAPFSSSRGSRGQPGLWGNLVIPAKDYSSSGNLAPCFGIQIWSVKEYASPCVRA